MGCFIFLNAEAFELDMRWPSCIRYRNAEKITQNTWDHASVIQISVITNTCLQYESCTRPTMAFLRDCMVYGIVFNNLISRRGHPCNNPFKSPSLPSPDRQILAPNTGKQILTFIFILTIKLWAVLFLLALTILQFHGRRRA